MHFYFLSLLFFQSAPWQAKVAERQYLSAARALQHNLTEKPSPELLLQYTFLIIDQYVHEVGYRVFYLRDMDSQEKIDFFRADPKVGGQVLTQPIELNLESLILNFRDGFPAAFETQLAIAYYLYFGRDRILEPRLKMDPDRIHELFVQAEQKQLATPFMLVTLANWDRRQTGSWSKLDLERCRKAYAKEPHRRDIATLYIECLLDLGQNSEVLPVARHFFDDSYALADRLFMIHAFTLANLRLGQMEAAMKSVAVGLRLAPEHFALWRDGLPAALAAQDSDHLRQYIALWLRDRELDPAAFQAFLTCFADHRERIVDILAQRTPESLKTDFEKMMFHFNQASFYVFVGRVGQAQAELTQSRSLAQQLNDEPFMALIDEVQLKMPKSGKQ